MIKLFEDYVIAGKATVFYVVNQVTGESEMKMAPAEDTIFCDAADIAQMLYGDSRDGLALYGPSFENIMDFVNYITVRHDCKAMMEFGSADNGWTLVRLFPNTRIF